MSPTRSLVLSGSISSVAALAAYGLLRVLGQAVPAGRLRDSLGEIVGPNAAGGGLDGPERLERRPAERIAEPHAHEADAQQQRQADSNIIAQQPL